MKQVTYTLIEFLSMVTGAGVLMAYAKWLLSNEPFDLRLIAGRAIINAFTGSAALIIIAIHPKISDYALYGLAFTLIVVGPVALEMLVRSVLKHTK